MRDVVHVVVSETLATNEPMPAWDTVDVAKLESALDAPRQAPFGSNPYPTLEAKAAVLLYGMAKNHAWSNGNKRMALIATMLFLILNGKRWDASQEEVFAHVVWVAASPANLRGDVLTYLTSYLGAMTVALVEGALARTDQD